MCTVETRICSIYLLLIEHHCHQANNYSKRHSKLLTTALGSYNKTSLSTLHRQHTQMVKSWLKHGRPNVTSGYIVKLEVWELSAEVERRRHENQVAAGPEGSGI